ncbi:Chitin synthase [Dictyocaulus viviparus]|uniref:chitin synthase n=1 Tax=Dictyocaulus viviparus TaxID=29172 RepID=A0A0D8YBE6_DICVI|nr:Chitin synthase [Dictyocaulus viviparus]
MSYFRSFFGGSGGENEEEDGAEIVEKMVERAETCTVLEDRRDALRALRSMAKKLRLAVGTMGLNVYMDILEKERANRELISITLEILVAVLSSDDENTDEDELGERLAEVMLKKPVFIPSLLAVVDDYDIAVRRQVILLLSSDIVGIQLLTSLLRHRGPEVQTAVMAQPTGVPHLVDIVHDRREIIRNEAVLMLCELSRSNSQIQQLLAYENAFIHLLDIIDTEPLDNCLFVVLNLLRKNAMNQQLFRENNLISRLGIILNAFLYGTEEDEPNNNEWVKQRTANMIFLLQVIRSLVSPDNAVTNTHAAQKALYQTKMLAELCRVLLSEMGLPVEVLTETVIAVAESIRGNYTNQEYFANTSLITSENINRSSLVVLLITMTAEKQPFKMRCAVFYCFLSYLHDNEFGKTKAITSGESVQCWFGCVVLFYCLLDVDHLREQLLRVQLSTTIDQPPISLVSMGNRRVQMRAGVLMLLSTWLNNCPAAVAMDDCGEGTESEQQVLKGLMAFLLLLCLQGVEDPNSRSSLEQLVDRRVGREVVIGAIEGLSRTEQFVRAAQKPQPLTKTPNELFLDYHFIKMFKASEAQLLKMLRPTGEINGISSNDSIIQSFKDLIKRQDEEIAILKQESKRYTALIEQLRQENNKSELEQELESLKKKLDESRALNLHRESIQVQMQEMYRINEQWREEAAKYKQWAEQWQQYQIAQLPNPTEAVVQYLQQQVQQLEQQLAYGYQAFEEHGKSTAKYAADCEEWKRRAEIAEGQLAEEQQKKVEGMSLQNKANGFSELDQLKAEQEDLLMLLADQHNKLTQYRNRLKELNQVTGNKTQKKNGRNWKLPNVREGLESFKLVIVEEILIIILNHPELPSLCYCAKKTYLLLFLVCNMFLTLGAAISKICVLILATNLWDKKIVDDPFVRKCSKIPIQRTPTVVAAIYLGLMFIQIIPDVVVFIRSLTRFYSGDKAGRVRIYFVVLETLRSFGLSLLVFTGIWVLPLGLLAISIGFWESWVSTDHLGTAFHELYQVKYGLRKLNISTRLMIAFCRMGVVLVIVMYASQGHVKVNTVLNVLTSYSFSFKQTLLLSASMGLILLNVFLRGCARFLAAIGMRAFSILHPVTIVPAVGYAIVALICSQKICGISDYLAKLGLRWNCDQWGTNARPFDDWYICMVWLAIGAYRGYNFVRQKSYEKCDEEPTLDIDDDFGDPNDELRVRNDEVVRVDRTLTIYICATMWHETATEMTQMLRSILKLDEEHARRLSTKQADQLRFRLEGHIFFDDSWDDQTEFGITKRVPNDFFRTFFKTLNGLTGEFVDESGSVMSRILLNTPYGGRLVVKLPAGTLLFVHLKDKVLIRHKKRWSQVMYMYYLLGHRIMDSPLSTEDRQQMADNTFILAIDGDSKFEPEAVIRLMNLMKTKSNIGCACGRIHPIGSGVMVWYQKFEYAIAHWFQKAAEHVFGCVLCAPGCFSLFRASALMDDNIMHKYTKTAHEPRHFVQYDQGEDRWLSTLMLKQGYRIEYVAASDAETYAPEGFEEFFNQRRRWTPSSIANTIDLLRDYKRASANNDSISMCYMAYQFMVIFFSMLGPAIIFTMLVFAQKLLQRLNAEKIRIRSLERCQIGTLKCLKIYLTSKIVLVTAFGVDSTKMMLYNGIPISFFILVCFTTESNVQLLHAKLMSIIYAFVMLAVLIATLSQIVLESIVFFLMIPSTYVFLTLYSLINLNVINWGTREAVAKATGKVETTSVFERWLRRIGESPWSSLCPTLRARPDETMQLIERKLVRMERSICQLQKSNEDDQKTKDHLMKLAKEVDDAAGTNDVVEIRRPLVESQPSLAVDKYAWMDCDYLQTVIQMFHGLQAAICFVSKICERGRLKGAEEEFWIQLIQTYLKPIESSPQQQSDIAEGLVSLRNSVAFSIIFLNALLALAIFLIQKHKNVLSIHWTPYDGFKWTKMNEVTGQFEETDDPLKVDPLGMAIIFFLFGILIVQTAGMLIHRLNTMIGTFQEVDQLHNFVPTLKLKIDDERVLRAARQMIDATSYAQSHAADGYTRHRELDAVNDVVLYKLQRAQHSKCMQQIETKK